MRKTVIKIGVQHSKDPPKNIVNRKIKNYVILYYFVPRNIL